MNITQKSLPTFEAKIYVGLRKRYTETLCKPIQVWNICQYAVAKGWCLTYTPTEFIYTPTYTTGSNCCAGSEPGYIIGAINYPRFPVEVALLKERVLDLARMLLVELDQTRISVVFTDETVMLEQNEERV